ncbi:MAG: hypothetical protein JXB88_26285 [Spirochaetales bacterium]|nr:hypothetical protein [Spirochaetales bacterium]
MDKTIRIVDFKNEFEAKLFCKILDDNNIPYYLKSLNDTAYDGIYQLSQGWGFLESSEEYKKQILSLYKEFIESEVFDDNVIDDNENREKEIKKIGFNFLDILAIIIIIILSVTGIILFKNNFNLNTEIEYYRNRKLKSYKWDNKIE